MFGKIFAGLLIIFFVGCGTSGSPPDVYDWLQGKLNETHILEEDNLLVLFVSEKMCSDCISKELININQSNFSKPIVIAGVFGKKRYFWAIINTVSIKNVPLYINSEEYTPDYLPGQPFYCVFDRTAQTVTKIFHPQPCDPEKTLQFFIVHDKRYNYLIISIINVKLFCYNIDY